MFKFVKRAFRTGVVTAAAPTAADAAPAAARGLPVLAAERCRREDYVRLAQSCPTAAMTLASLAQERDELFRLNLGACIGCGRCEEQAPEAVRLTGRADLAARTRDDLARDIPIDAPPAGGDPELERLGDRVRTEIERLFGRSLQIREVDSGSCNACEWEITALLNPIYDIQRFGIDFVASPRFADMLLVTGSVTRAMAPALRRTYDATPEPKLVVAVGACACNGGLFDANYTTVGALDKVLPVDVYIPGCPPTPQAILHGILLAIGRAPQNIRRGLPLP